MDYKDLAGRLRVGAGLASPRRLRWKRFLRTVPLDPDSLVRPIVGPSDRDFIICGSPRSGTTLAAAVLYQPPSVVTVNEPWDGMRMTPANLFNSLRGEIAKTGQLRKGRLNVPALFQTGRVKWCSDGEIPVDVDLAKDYLLGVKWPAFWRYVELLPQTKFVVCVRHPAEVISSYKMKGGRLIGGLEYEIPFNREMNAELKSATRNLALRRVLMYEYINTRLLGHLNRPNVFALRYERWFAEPRALMAELSSFLGTELGPGPATIRPSTGELSVTRAEMGYLRTHCQSAEALGYDVDVRPRAGQLR